MNLEREQVALDHENARRDREQAALNRENALQAREELQRSNEQLCTQIVTLRGSQKHQRSVSPHLGKDSDGEISRHSPPWKKAEEIPSLRSIEELIL